MTTQPTLDIPHLIARVKLIFQAPKRCWDTISSESDSPSTILIKTIIPLVCVGIIASVVGLQVFGIHMPLFGTWRPGLIASFFQQVIMGGLLIGGLFLDALILQTLAPKFGGSVTFDRAFSLIAHSAVPAVSAQMLGILPALLPASLLFSLLSIYVLFQGVGKMITIAEDKRRTFFGVSLVTMLVAHIILGMLVFDLSPTPFNDIGSLGR